MPFYGIDFYTDPRVRLLTEAQQGIYLRLLWEQWQEGAVPDTPASCTRLIGTTLVEDVTIVLDRFFEATGGAMAQNKKLAAIRKYQETILAAKRRGAQKARNIKANSDIKADIKADINPDFKGESKSKSKTTTTTSVELRSTGADAPKTFHQIAAPALRAAGVWEAAIADVLKNWWPRAVKLTSGDEELAAFILWVADKRMNKGKPWNPAAQWNVNSDLFSERFKYHLAKFWNAPKPQKRGNAFQAKLNEYE